MPYPRFQRSRSHKFALRSTGDVAITSTSFTVVDGGMDLTLDVQPVDVVELGVSLAAAHNTASGLIAFDVGTLVAGSVVSRVSGNTEGVSGWRESRAATAELVPISGSYLYVVTGADMVGTTATFRLLARTNTGTLTVYADGAARRLQFWARNLGPVDPN